MYDLSQPPRREVAQEFYTEVIALGEFALDQYLKEVARGKRLLSFVEVREMQENIKTCKAELAKYL